MEFKHEKSKRLHLSELNAYEDRLLASLAFFRFRRSKTNQAIAALSMYLRQSADRINGEVAFYAKLVGLSAEELANLIWLEPEKAEQMLKEKLGEGFHSHDEHDG